MKFLSVLISLLLVISAYSQTIDVPGAENVSKAEVKAMTTDIIKNTPITRKSMIEMIDKMVASGQITKADGEATKSMLLKMDDKAMAAFKQTMVNMMGAKIDQMKFPKSKQ